MKTSLLALSILISIPAVAGEAVSYTVEGAGYEGHYSAAQGQARGSVLLIHDWDGLTGYEVRRADMLAKMGYNTFAVDLYGKGNRPVETDAKKAEMGKLYKDREKMRKLILAGLDEARKHGAGDVVVAGYCFGGAATLELARSGKGSGIKGFATFHGGLKTPANQSYSSGTPPLFIAHGGADSSITMSDVSALSEQLEVAKVPYLIHVYAGAPHAFTVFDSSRYQKTADEKSWAAFGEFLGETLVP